MLAKLKALLVKLLQLLGLKAKAAVAPVAVAVEPVVAKVEQEVKPVVAVVAPVVEEKKEV